MGDELTTRLVRHPDGTTELVVRGEVDLASAPAFRAALAESAAPPDVSLVIDLREVGYLDSAGIEVLFDQARQRWIELVVRPNSPIIRVLEISGLAQAVPVRAQDSS
jgi:anti-sigma B factor antagonist